MKKIMSIAFVCILISSVTGKNVNIDLDSLLEICQSAQDGLNDVYVEYDFDVINPYPEEVNEVVRKIGGFFNKGPEHVQWWGVKPFKEFSKSISKSVVEDTAGKTSELLRCRSYNGKTAKTYQMEQDALGTVQTGGISADLRENNLSILDFTTFYTEEGYDVAEGIRHLKDNNIGWLKLNLEIKKVNDFNTINIEHWKAYRDKNLLIRRYTFSIDHNFTLIRIEFSNGKDVVGTHDVLALTQIENGIWFPTECRAFASDGLTNTIKVKKIAANQGLTDKDFDIEFPPGTKVNDEITGKQYTIKPTQEQLDQSLPK
jgi:hypothetical protein